MRSSTSYPLTKVIMVTGNDSRENALTAIQPRRRGLVLEADPARRAAADPAARAAHPEHRAELGSAAVRCAKRYHRMVGESEAIRGMFALIQRVALTDATVLIVGENGTGKELVAHAIHEASRRRDGPFVPINCGAIPETLLESELFGHERGAFTDAHRAREGKLEVAAGGTVFLDEIGELPTHLQVKLLRFLQDHRVERDRRARAASSRRARASPPPTTISRPRSPTGRFREDLYYRLCVVTMPVPPLRERGDDARMLAEYFLEFYSRQYKRRIKAYTQAALRAIQAHAWPGNVRELENRVQRARDPGAGRLRAAAGSRVSRRRRGESPRTLADAREQAEQTLIIESLTRNAGNITRAARDIEVSRPTFHDLLRKHGIDAGRYRRPGPAGRRRGECGDRRMNKSIHPAG